MPVITALYAGLLGLMSIAVAVPAGRMRGAKQIPIGDGGDREMLLAMRRHANFAEWVPLAIILIGLLEMNGVSRIAIHLLGGGLVVARANHAIGLRGDTMAGVGRTLGSVGTLLVTVVASIWSIASFF